MSLAIVAAALNAGRSRGALPIWTVCQDPRDHPGKWTARLGLIERGAIQPTRQVFIHDTPEQFRSWFRQAGLVRMHRDPLDEPQIVEVWL